MAADKEKDYTKKTFLLTAMVIAVLAGVSFIPPFTVGGVNIKRANIFSDIVDFGDAPVIHETSESLVDTSFYAFYDASRSMSHTTAETVEEFTNGNDAGDPVLADSTTVSIRGIFRTKPEIDDPSIVCIEDFSEGETMMSRFYHSLAYQPDKRTVRIAVLGDSFIEADIITADLREQLQMEYGGSGVGFVPFSTPLSKYRGTVRHTHEGWDYYNVIKLKSVPEEYKPWFFVSGILSIPNEGATTEYKGVQFRNRIEKTNSASLLFVNRGNSSIDVTINDTQTVTYKPESGQDVQCIQIRRPDISQIKVKINNAKDFIGYGTVLEDSVGVSVHNYSVRSNSGTALFGTDYRINSQIDGFMQYDLIILQYGLNAMSADVTNYSYYGRQLVRIINYIKECFPNSAIVVMSVGDRSSVKGGTATTMPAVEAMIKAQRDAAQVGGIGFWNTFEAMGGKNSMPTFVERQWASKDHTHIGYPGGKYIAERLVAFLNAAVESIREQNGPIFEPILDGKHDSVSLPVQGTIPSEQYIDFPDSSQSINTREILLRQLEELDKSIETERGTTPGVVIEENEEYEVVIAPLEDSARSGETVTEEEMLPPASAAEGQSTLKSVINEPPAVATAEDSVATDSKSERQERRKRRKEKSSQE